MEPVKTSIRESVEFTALHEYWILVNNNKLLIIFITMLITIYASFYAYTTKETYMATAVMVIEKEQNKSPVTGEFIQYSNYRNQKLAFTTHIKLMKSRPVLSRVVKSLKLIDFKDTAGMGLASPLDPMLWVHKGIKNIKLLWEKKQVKVLLTPVQKEATMVSRLRGHISLKPLKETLLVQINVENQNAEWAYKIANELGKEYIDFNKANREEYSQKSITWMTKQLAETRIKLEKAEKDFLEYKNSTKVFSVKGKQLEIRHKIEEFNEEYIKTKNKRMELESKLKRLENNVRKYGNVRSLIDNTLIDDLNRQLVGAEVELSRIEKIYKSKHPQVVQIKTKIANIRKKIKNQILKELNNMRNQKIVFISKEKVLQQTIDDYEEEALAANSKELDYTILERTVSTNQKLYDILLAKIESANVTGNVDNNNNIRIVEHAALKPGPIKPKKLFIISASLFFGLFLSIAVVILRSYLKRSITNDDDVEKYIELPVLSVIPKLDKAKKAYSY